MATFDVWFPLKSGHRAPPSLMSANSQTRTLPTYLTTLATLRKPPAVCREIKLFTPASSARGNAWRYLEMIDNVPFLDKDEGRRS